MPVKGGDRTVKKDRMVLSQKLVVQGSDTVMIPVGEVPVISGPAEFTLNNWTSCLCMALNFLRCGSPEVVIWATPHVLDEEECLTFQKDLNKSLDVLSGKKAEFTNEYRGDGVFVIRYLREDSQKP